MTGPFRTAWQMDYPLAQSFLQSVFTTGASANESGWSSKGFDAAVNKANAEAREERVNATYQAAEKLLVKDMPSIPLWYQNGIGGYSDRVEHVGLNPFSVPVYTDITVKKD